MNACLFDVVQKIYSHKSGETIFTLISLEREQEQELALLKMRQRFLNKARGHEDFMSRGLNSKPCQMG